MTSSDWTTVTTSHRRCARRGRIARYSAPRGSAAAGSNVATTVQDLATKYATYQALFRESKLNIAIKKRLEAWSWWQSPLLAIESAVCLGLGSFEAVDAGTDAQHKAFVQLVCFEAIVGMLSESD